MVRSGAQSLAAGLPLASRCLGLVYFMVSSEPSLAARSPLGRGCAVACGLLWARERLSGVSQRAFCGVVDGALGVLPVGVRAVAGVTGEDTQSGTIAMPACLFPALATRAVGWRVFALGNQIRLGAGCTFAGLPAVVFVSVPLHAATLAF